MSTGAENRRARWRERHEETFRSGTERNVGKHVALVEEVAELQRIEAKEDQWERMFTLVTSSVSLAIFWVIGGAVFMAIEGYAFGSSMYFCERSSYLNEIRYQS